MKLQIKKATKENLFKLNEIIRLSKGYWGYDTEFLDEFMAKFGITEEYLKEFNVYSVFIEKEMIGVFGFTKNDDNQDELDLFFLHPSYIGRGLGKELWGLCLNEAKNLDIKKFKIMGDPNSELFYLKMGCIKVGTVPSPISLLPGRTVPIFEYSF